MKGTTMSRHQSLRTAPITGRSKPAVKLTPVPRNPKEKKDRQATVEKLSKPVLQTQVFGGHIIKPQHGTRSEIVTVTPEMAQEWYISSRINRSIRPEKVAAYARDMKAKAWDYTGHPILFAKEGFIPDHETPGGKRFIPEGTMIDGHHRCLACDEAKVPFNTRVEWGIDPAVWKNIDTNMVRTPTDVLVGEKYRSTLSAALSHLFRYRRGRRMNDGSMNMTRREEFCLLEKEPSLRSSVEEVHRLTDGYVKLIPNSALAFFLHVFSEKDADLAKLFITALTRGQGTYETGKTASVHTLRRQLSKWSTQPGRHPINERLAAVIKAWNLARRGAAKCHERALAWIRYGEKAEAFPVIE